MRLTLVLSILSIILLGPAAIPALGQDGGNPPTQQQIDQLIEQLGDDSIETRSDAQAALERIGEPAIPALQKALKDGDPERAARARDILQKIKVVKIVQDFDLNGNPIKKSEYNGKGELIRETEYGPGGVVVKVTEYRNGKPVKTTEYKDGKPVKVTEYKDGKPIKLIELDKDGKPVKVTDLDPTNDRIPKGLPGLGSIKPFQPPPTGDAELEGLVALEIRELLRAYEYKVPPSALPIKLEARLLKPILIQGTDESTILEIETSARNRPMYALAQVRYGPAGFGRLGKAAIVTLQNGRAALPVYADKGALGKFDVNVTLLSESMIRPRWIPCSADIPRCGAKCGDKPEVCFDGGGHGTKLTPCTFSLNPCDGTCALFAGHKGKHYCSHGHRCTH